jgi:exopolyphosphatase/guanosine-5'-triphosphate,3'-diphosphate pyrophosphatase
MTLSPSPFANEFRFFGASLLYERALLLARARAHETYRTSESYILSRGVNDVNVKIRAGRIEVKLLIARAGPLEGWERAFEADLPITADTFATHVAARLGVDVRLENDLELNEPAILLIAEECRDLSAVRVDKLRTVFDLGSCRSEFAALTVGFHRVDTIAIESPDPNAVLRMLRRLDFVDRTNESYPAFLNSHFDLQRGYANALPSYVRLHHA